MPSFDDSGLPGFPGYRYRTIGEYERARKAEAQRALDEIAPHGEGCSHCRERLASRRRYEEIMSKFNQQSKQSKQLPHTRADIDHPTPEARTKFNQERNDRIVNRVWPNSYYPITLECPRCFFEFGHMKEDKSTKCFYCEEISQKEAPGQELQNHTVLDIVIVRALGNVWGGLKLGAAHPVPAILVVTYVILFLYYVLHP
jgi:hypothetical protein